MQTKSLKAFLDLNNFNNTQAADIDVDACGLSLSLSRNVDLIPCDDWQCDIDGGFIMISTPKDGKERPVCYGELESFLRYLMKRETFQAVFNQ